MKLLILLIPLAVCILLSACNYTPFTPDDYGTPPPENLDGNPVTIDDEMVYVSPYEGEIEVVVQSHTRDAFVWGENLTVTSRVDWIEISGPAAEVEPYCATTFNVKVYREGLDPGSYGEYLTLWYNDRFMQYEQIHVQVGTPDAVPIGVANNYIRIPAEKSEYPLHIFNNADDLEEDDYWWNHISFESSEEWMSIGITRYNIFPPVPPMFFIDIERNAMHPGIYPGRIDIFWDGDLVQTINVEMEVGE